MDLTPMHKRVIALDVHQAKITACAVSNMMTAEWRLPSATSVPSIATAAPWHSGRWRSGPRLSSWRARGCIGRARLRRWRRWASSPGWSTRGTSRPYPVARPIWPMRNGWPRWRALRAIAAGRNIAKDPGIEIMRYASGERQIERSFSIGLHKGENNAVFVLFGKMDNLVLALSAIRKLILERPCSELLAYSNSKREKILSLFGISNAEIEASLGKHIPELVIERVALADFVK